MRPFHRIKCSSILPTINSSFRIAFPALVLAAATINSHAALLAYEGFDYTEGVSVVGLSGGTGFNNAWQANNTPNTAPNLGAVIEANSLTYIDGQGNTLHVVGGKGKFTGQFGTAQPNRDVNAVRGTNGTDGVTTWLSFLAIRQGPATNNANVPGNPYPRGANISLYNGGTEKLATGNPSTAVSNVVSLLPQGQLGNVRPSSITFTQVNFIVVRVEHVAGGLDNAYLFVNPPLNSEPDITAANTNSLGLFDYSFTRIRPFAGNTRTQGGQPEPYAEILLDEIRLGETYADVTPHIPGVQPGREITWVGTASGNWDTSTANWRTNGGPLTAFVDGDFARFDDTATGETNINLTTGLRPYSITVNNEASRYRFTGSGNLTTILGLTKSGAGTLILDNSGNNTFLGGVLISGGTLRVGSGGEDGTLTANNITNDAALVIDRTGTVTIGSAISGTGSLTKVGAGTLVLSGASSYTGATEVNGGTLLLNGTLLGGGTLTTAAGTTLGGSGTTAGSLTAGGLVSPGGANTAGTLTIGAATLASGATVKFDLNNANTPGGAVNDLLQVNGDLTVNDNSIIVNFIGFPQTGVPYRLINYTGTKVGSFNAVVTGTHYTATLDESVAGEVNVTFSGTGASLKWNSTSSSVWDLGVSANWLNLGTSLPDVFHAGDAVLFDDSVAGVVANVTIAAAVAPAALTITGGVNYTFSGAGRVSGPTTLLKQGVGTLTISNANDFTGAVTIEGGILKAGSDTALGTGAAGTTITSGATLDINGRNLTAEAITVSGNGVDDKGAIISTGPDQINALRNVTLESDVTFGGTGRWDIRNVGGNATLLTGGNYYSIKKVGPNQVSLVAIGQIDSRFGDIDVREGTFAIQTSTVQVGDPFGFVTVHGGATLGLWGLNAAPLNKIQTFNDGASILNENGRSVIEGQSTLNGNVSINALNAGTSPVLEINGLLDGDGGITKIGVGTNALNNSHTYRGPTVVSNGTLLVDGEIRSSSSVTVYGGTLGGVGQISSPVVVAAGGTLAPGNTATPIAAFAASSSLSLAGTNVMDVSKTGGTITGDSMATGSLTYGGTLRLNLTGTLAGGDIIPLFSFSSANGAFSAIIPATPGIDLQWDTSQLTASGVLRVLPASQPTVSTITQTETNLTLSGTNGPPNWTYRVLTSTDIGLPVANWTPIQTNAIDANGNFSFAAPIEIGTPQRFFILAVP
jgi:autotransporter-associated beta strand protein